MALFDAFLSFKGGGSCAVKGETEDDVFKAQSAFEIQDFSFDVENATTIGSATGEAGAGKAKFNEFSVTKQTDTASAIFFKALATGTHYDEASLSIRKAGGDQTKSGKPYLVFTFGTVFVTKLEWSGGGDGLPTEKLSFAYGALRVAYAKQKKDGSLEAPTTTEWSQIKNKATFA